MRVSLKTGMARRAISHQASAALSVETLGRGQINLTAALIAWLREIEAGEGAVTLFCRHTSASLTVQENADPRVMADLTDALDRLAPETLSWRHDDEGPDDMPAHVKTSLTSASLTIPVAAGRLQLGTWQAVYLLEHRRNPHRREVSLHYLGN